MQKKMVSMLHTSRQTGNGMAKRLDIRNREMAQNADALVAFWDGESRGTESMIDLAKEYDLAVRVLKF